MGDIGLPQDPVAWATLGLCILIAAATYSARAASERVGFWLTKHYGSLLTALAIVAAVLSAGYVTYYLRGGPRIIDATAYLHEARIFATGHFSLQPGTVSAALRGRFLYFSPELKRISVLFPPGYPLLLALGVVMGQPLLVGPVLAGVVTWLTGALAKRLFDDTRVALLAASLSALNACLRYHTADTMSHGLCSALILGSLLAFLHPRKIGSFIGALLLGWLIATRPVTGGAVALAIALWLTGVRRSRGTLVPSLLGLLPGLGLFVAYQWATTGHALGSTQLAYYATADGPPGCFRYGFGQGIGCLYEHGSYVARRLPHGYGLGQALYVTLLRLRWHALDVLNVELLFPLVLIGIYKGFKEPSQRLLTFAIAFTILGYVPFYFDGSYPGGGARFYADVIPLEQVLVAGLWLTLPEVRWLVPATLFGFAFHGSFEHTRLKERDGGSPMFDAKVLAAKGITKGLVFVDTDHGFHLGHDPAVTTPARGVVVLRHHGDAHDRLIWEALGRPPAYDYRFNPQEHAAQATVQLIAPSQLSSWVGFEGESQWPPLHVEGGYVLPVYPPNDCTSNQRGLSLEPVLGKARASVALHVPKSGRYALRVKWVARESGSQNILLTLGSQELVISRFAAKFQCFETRHEGLALDAGESALTATTGGLGIVLDRYEIEPD